MAEKFRRNGICAGESGLAGKAYHPDFAYPTGSVEAEANWFFDRAMAAAKEVGDAKVNSLTPNTGIVPQTEGCDTQRNRE